MVVDGARPKSRSFSSSATLAISKGTNELKRAEMNGVNRCVGGGAKECTDQRKEQFQITKIGQLVTNIESVSSLEQTQSRSLR